MAIPPVRVTSGANSEVPTGGQSVVAFYGQVVGGALLFNPAAGYDQGIESPEVLFVDLTGPAAARQTATTTPIYPGGVFLVPPGVEGDVWANAATSGHRFTALLVSPISYTPPTPGAFPPLAPTGLLKTIPSYLYQQYSDDDDLPEFVAAYNTLAQVIVDWFNQTLLPVYTSPTISGSLLDWVAQGLYGISRPSLSSGSNRNIGPLNTYGYNELTLNTVRRIGAQNVTVTSDDIFKRILTWNLYQGDGKIFNIRWLKRRILRFLLGINGTAPDVSDTSQISVTFGTGNQVNITLLSGERVATGGAFLNRFGLNTTQYNQVDTSFTKITPFPDGPIFAEAVNSGVLQLPFQFTWVVNLQ